MSYQGLVDIPSDIRQRIDQSDRVDPLTYYFRTTPRFETESEKYSWLNRLLAVAIGERIPTGAIYTVYTIL